MPKPFSPPGTPARYTPDRPFTTTRLALELDLDLAGRRLAGVATLEIESRRENLARVTLDAVEMTIDGVTVDEQAVTAYDYDGDRLGIPLPSALRRGESATIAVRYRAAPRRGLYFLGPDASNPDRPPQCWTQGQDDDSRYYFPCVDTPIEKAPTEVAVIAPAGNTVLSNGDLVGREPLPDGRVRWSYRLEFPHPPYLVSVVCGPFVELRDRAPETGVDVYAYVAPGREEDARRTFVRTPAMIDFFSARIGVAYPHRRYSQITVPEFIFGGMENTSATTLTELTLLDERAALDHDSDGLVSHELAHQWWGDLVTCREWSEAWLNEGFAKYFEYVWLEHRKGRDEADVALLNNAEVYLAETNRYLRPIAWRRYDEPIHIFDGHLYDKGARVLHMVRNILGEEAFWDSIQGYAKKHAGGSVETRDLVRAIEEATGRNLEPFFDRWIARAGHPELACSWEWDDERGLGRLRIEQKQAITDDAPAFDLTFAVRFEVAGQMRDESFRSSTASQVFEVRLAARPTQVVFDPGDVVLKTVKMDKAGALWRRQLAAATLGVDRILAAGALGNAPDPRAVEALGRALATDPFWAVRAAAARALGKTRRQDALDGLLAARGQEHPRVRRAVATALGEYRGDARAASAVTDWLRAADASVFVEAELALALGRVRAPAALELLPELARRPSFQGIVRARAIDGLGATADERAIPILRAEWRDGGPWQPRRALVTALGDLAAGTTAIRAVREFLEDHLGDADFRVRGEIGAVIARLGERQGLPALERALGTEMDGRARRRLRDAIAELRDGQRPNEQVVRLQEEVERLRGETAKLRERVDQLEQRPAPSKPPAVND